MGIGGVTNRRGSNVLVELESASLSRDIPPCIKQVSGVSSYRLSSPKESLESVLTCIREHVK
jgi:hypothetical protein